MAGNADLSAFRAAASARALPQVRAWSPQPQPPGPPRSVSRTFSEVWTDERPCTDCGELTTPQEFEAWTWEYYFVHDHVWAAASGPGPDLSTTDGLAQAWNENIPHWLCIGCLEARLGRELIPADFIASGWRAGWRQMPELLWTARLLHRVHGAAWAIRPGMEQSPRQVTHLVTWALRDLGGLVLTGTTLHGNPAGVSVQALDENDSRCDAWQADRYAVTVTLVCRSPDHMDLIADASAQVLKRLGLAEVTRHGGISFGRPQRQEGRVTAALAGDLDYPRPPTAPPCCPLSPARRRAGTTRPRTAVPRQRLPQSRPPRLAAPPGQRDRPPRPATSGAPPPGTREPTRSRWPGSTPTAPGQMGWRPVAGSAPPPPATARSRSALAPDYRRTV